MDSEGLLTYVTTGKLKLGKRIAYKFVCSTECQVTATTTLVLRGPDVGPIVDTGLFPAGQIIEVFLKPNKSARRAIRKHIGDSKLRTSVTAINPGPYGENDTDTRLQVQALGTRSLWLTSRSRGSRVSLPASARPNRQTRLDWLRRSLMPRF